MTTHNPAPHPASTGRDVLTADAATADLAEFTRQLEHAITHAAECVRGAAGDRYAGFACIWFDLAATDDFQALTSPAADDVEPVLDLLAAALHRLAEDRTRADTARPTPGGTTA